MKNMKISLKETLAKGCISIGETGATTYSFFFNWYEPKISRTLLENKSSK